MPFGPYEDFADCVAKNSDKDDPEAYCGYLQELLKDAAAANRAGDDGLSDASEPKAAARMSPMRFEIVPVIDTDAERFVDAVESGEPADEGSPDGNGSDDAENGSEPESEETGGDTASEFDFHTLLVVEGIWTGDGRWIEPDSLSWRNLPLPLMGLDRTTEAHMEAKLIGNLVQIERVGNELHGYGVFVDSDDTEVMNLQRLIRQGELRGVSVDLDAVEYEVLMDGDPDEVYTDENGDVVMAGEDWRMRITSARLMGATVVPFPAFEEAYIEMVASLIASIQRQSVATGYIVVPTEPDVVIAAGHPIAPPVVPPGSWFEPPLLNGPTPLTVTDEGQVFGHLATWGQCHIGFSQCITPPTSQTNYAHFRTGEILTEEGLRFAVGQITLGTGHADQQANARAAARHYDHTGSAVADVIAGEDEHGIWVAGALRSTVTAEQIRELMAADVSGDWRRVGGNLELVGILAVNVPGFPKVRVAEADGLVASLSLRAYSGSESSAVDRLHAERLAARADAVAARIGRSRADRVAALRRRIAGY